MANVNFTLSVDGIERGLTESFPRGVECTDIAVSTDDLGKAAWTISAIIGGLQSMLSEIHGELESATADDPLAAPTLVEAEGDSDSNAAEN